MEDWKVIGEFIYDEDGGRHQAFLSPNKEVTILGTTIKQAERLKIEQSLKYSQVGGEKLWRPVTLGLRPEVASPQLIAYLAGKYVNQTKGS